MNSAVFPFEGKYFRAQQKKFAELVFFVHFYQGSVALIRRHIDWVNSLGFDAFAFELNCENSLRHLPLTSKKKLGVKHRMAEDIEILLNQLPEKKIIFSFSNPTAAVIEALARRQCHDIVALICDSGPSANLLASVNNLMKYNQKLSLWKRVWSIPWATALWSPSLHRDLIPDLKTFPQGFKILSIRGGKDKLIPPNHIEAVFSPHPQLDVRKLILPEADHLVGLRNFREPYTEVTREFLLQISQKDPQFL